MIVMVMDVGIVRVGMRQPCVLMAVGVRFAWRIAGRVFVLVVLVVIVEVLVFHWFVNVPVFVAFGHMEPNADEHEDACRAKCPIKLPLFGGERKPRACERCGGKIRAGTRCSEIP